MALWICISIAIRIIQLTNSENRPDLTQLTNYYYCSYFRDVLKTPNSRYTWCKVWLEERWYNLSCPKISWAYTEWGIWAISVVVWWDVLHRHAMYYFYSKKNSLLALVSRKLNLSLFVSFCGISFWLHTDTHRPIKCWRVQGGQQSTLTVTAL